MKNFRVKCGVLWAAMIAITLLLGACGESDSPSQEELVKQGKEIFRYATFGDEWFWTDTLKMDQVVASLTPAQALSLGLKVDVEALPQAVIDGLTDDDPNTVPLDDPATTLALLKLNAVVGVQGTVNEAGELVNFGVTCALCHSTVDNSFAPGIGHRLDGWPNVDLRVGDIIAASPVVEGEAAECYASFPAGMYDPRFNLDGKCNPVVIPPAYGLKGVPLIIFTGDGADISYWNRYVGVTQMHGQGTFSDPRLPFDANIDYTGKGNDGNENLVEPKLEALQAYQLSLETPDPLAGSFDGEAAARGETVFNGQAQCSTCHVPSNNFTQDELLPPTPSNSMAEPETPSYAERSATGKYRVTPLRGLALQEGRSFFHNGSAATLLDAVNTYNSRLSLGLSDQQIDDLVEYLKSL